MLCSGGRRRLGRGTIEKYVMPNVSIEFVTFKWGEMTPKLMTASAGGAAPHITRQDRFRMAGWAGRGGATLLDDFVDQYNINGDDYFPATWAEGVWAGKVYSIPSTPMAASSQGPGGR